ncbi:MAG: hypothetical protein LKM30_00620 [Bacilli bacterium]|jgi:hypothetical protein|nr:hypothetical protein [Bacilli bacterium]
MAKSGRKPNKSTPLSVVFHDFKNATCDDRKVNDFASTVLLNLITDKPDCKPSEDITNSVMTKVINTYFSGENPPRDQMLTSIIKCLDKTKFIDWVNNEYSSILENTAIAFQKYDETKHLHKGNVAEAVFEAFRRAFLIMKNPDSGIQLKIAAGSSPEDTEKAFRIKEKYANVLLSESDFSCEMDGTSLLNATGKPDFCVCLVDETLPESQQNVIILCNNCYRNIVSLSPVERKEKLTRAKAFWTKKASLRSVPCGTEFVEELSDLLETLKTIEPIAEEKLISESELRLVPLKVEEKLGDEHLFCEMVKTLASEEYPQIKKALKIVSNGKDGGFSEVLAADIRSAYLHLAQKQDGSFFKEDIFFALGQTIANRTAKKLSLCYALVAYYVQDCEVFNAITK